MSEKWEAFRREISVIQDLELREFVKTVLNSAPEYFWRIAASASGQHHPADDLGTGGLVHHTKKVVYFVKEFCVAMELESEKDCLVAAAILHDVYKYGDSIHKKQTEEQWLNHGGLVKWLVEQDVYKLPIEEVFQGEILKKVQKVLRLVATHFGIWGLPENKPKTREEWLVHLADYVASRKLVTITEGL